MRDRIETELERAITEVKHLPHGKLRAYVTDKIIEIQAALYKLNSTVAETKIRNDIEAVRSLLKHHLTDIGLWNDID